MSIELAENKQHIVIKRRGHEEPYSEDKMRNFLMYACDDNKIFVDSIMREIEIKIYNKIHITVLYEEVMDTVNKMISRLTPSYEKVLRKIYLLKMYKETWGIKKNKYPSLQKYFDRLGIVSVVDIRSTESLSRTNYSTRYKLIPFTNEELRELDEAIVQDRDLISPYLGMKTFFNKYSKRENNQPVELLQHGFMRVAIQAYIHYPKSTRIRKIINRYNNLSLAKYTEASPKFLNSLNFNPGMASCCVHKAADNSESINRTTSDINQYSRFNGGNAIDVSDFRANGSKIGLSGESSGPVNFIRMIQSGIEAFNQLGSRPGACAVYYQWWHADIFDLLPLQDEGGEEEQRARKLKFGIKFNRYVLRKFVERDSYIYLFDPKVVPHLNELIGVEFDKAYEEAVLNELYSQKVSTKRLALEFATQYSETGNLYPFFIENANEQSCFNGTIYSSNLCGEIFLATEATSNFKSKLTINQTTNEIETSLTEDTGLTALCNLSSLNLLWWIGAGPTERRELVDELLESSDNLIDLQYYPTKAGEAFNRNFRAIGIGRNNQAHLFAELDIRWDSDSANNLIDSLEDSICSMFEDGSNRLAIERGSFNWISKTSLSSPNRFATLFAVAPGATNSLISGLTEGIEPISKQMIEKTNDDSVKQLAPNFAFLYDRYDLADSIPTSAIYRLVATRQKRMDKNGLGQGQSINTYTKDNGSAAEIINNIILAESLGLKSLYYLKSNTSQLDACDSCGS